MTMLPTPALFFFLAIFLGLIVLGLGGAAEALHANEDRAAAGWLTAAFAGCASAVLVVSMLFQALAGEPIDHELLAMLGGAF